MAGLKDKIEDIFPLTPLQKGLLFHTIYEPESGVYFEQLHCRLEGDVSTVAVRQAWQTLVDRHAILRTAIVTKGQSEPVQVVFRHLKFNIEEEDWRGLSDDVQKHRLQDFLEADKRKGFVLNRPPLMRVTLIRFREDVWYLVWSHHHIILDGWSWPILLKEFLTLHKAAKENIEVALPNRRPYGDFIAWLKRKDLQESKIFWQQYMSGFESATPLLMTSKSRVNPKFKGGEITKQLSPEITDLLGRLARNCSVTLNTVIQGAWAILLNRYSRSNDVVYGITVGGRPPEIPGVEQMIGPFINTLPFRVAISGDQTLNTWLQNLQFQAASMRQFEHTSLSDIRAWSDIPAGSEMFETLLAFENFPVDKLLKISDFGLNVAESHFLETTHYPITLVVIPSDTIAIKLSYNTNRFSDTTMKLLLDQFSNLLLNMANHPQSLLQDISLLSHQEKQQIKNKREQTNSSYTTINEMFAETASKYPERIALTYENQTLTYRELEERSNAIACHLKSLGIGSEKRVVICLDRTPELIISMLGVVKAGGIYVPVDPSYPRDRIEFTITDCGAEVIITTTNTSQELPNGITRVCLDVEDAAYLKTSAEPIDTDNVTPNSGAYIIYTSGSTGKPKGVLVTHKNLTRLFKSTEHWFKFNQQDVWTFFHSFAFDFSVWEIWGALLYGGRLVIVPYCVSRDPQTFLRLLEEQKVTVLNQTPSAFAQLLAVADSNCNLDNLRYVIFGGEALNLGSLSPWFEKYGDNQTRLVNMYGITETTVHVTYRPISKQDIDNLSGSLIGEPIPDLDIYILDADGNLLPTGVIGEMYIGGAGVAHSYLNRPELTAERFIEARFRPNCRLYRTGDLGRFLPNGDLEYLGRIDYQVKIRGFRIEIGEIENVLAEISDVHENIVLVTTDIETGENRLIAYLVCSPEKQPTIKDIRDHLQRSLPDYMIPSQVVYLDKFPLTANGKIDRKSLPIPEMKRENIGIEFAAPETEIERKLASIWQQVLGVERVGRFDNYFVLGGDSIRSIRVCSLAQAAGFNLKIEQIFTHPILADLATDLETTLQPLSGGKKQDYYQEPFGLIATEDREKLTNIADDAYPLAQLQAGMWFHTEYSQTSTTYQDLFSFRIRIPFNLQVWEQAYSQMFTRHPVLRTAFFLGEFSQPLQAIIKDVSGRVIFKNLTNLSPSAQDDYLRVFIEGEQQSRFNYKNPPLIRFFIHQLSEDVVEATLVLHHAIMDGWSLAQFLTDLTGLYLHLMGRGVPSLSPQTGLEYSQFIALEQEALQDKKQREFWQQQLEDIPLTKLPRLPRKNLPKMHPTIGKVDITLSQTTSQGLKDVAHQLGVPLRTVLLAIHLHILSVFSGDEEIVTGLVSNGRPDTTDGDQVLGLFLNTLPLRLRLPHGSWVDLIKATWLAEQALVANRRFPLPEVQRLNGGLPLYETSLNFIHFHVYQGLLNWREVELLKSTSFEETNIPFAVTWNQEVASANISLNIAYSHAEFTQDQVDNIANYYQLCSELVSENCVGNREFSLAPQEFIYEKQLSTSRPTITPVHQIVAQQAAVRPKEIAVICEGEGWTYEQLNQKANQLAHFLQSQGITQEKPVGICLERSLDMVCAMLGVMKAGGCYVPIDPHYPSARVQSMLEGANLDLLLTRSDLKVNYHQNSQKTIFVDTQHREIGEQSKANLNVSVFPDNIAYIIFTSGSTGKAKGVAISHGALVSHQTWFVDKFSVTNADIVLQKTPFSFDASVWEFWTPLMVGGKLVMAKPGGHQDPAYLVKTIQQEKVTLFQLVPSLLEVVLGEPELEHCGSLRLVFSGGEVLKNRVWQKFQEKLPIPLINLYGPTETTIDVTFHNCQENDNIANLDQIPLGQPVTNVKLYILNSLLQPVPIGTPGKIFVSGCQVARGYWHAPGMTAERFLPDPFVPGQRMYDTGDRARYLPGGNIEFLGRIDQQIKVRGFRIETSEIVAALEAQSWVNRALVKVISDSQISSSDRSNYLVAYVQPRLTTPNNWQKILRLELGQILPEYMIPTLFINIDTLPLLPNGKIDINSLPDPEVAKTTLSQEYIAPESETEQILTELWQRVLKVPRLGTRENFFELGGDSIIGLQIIAKARDLGIYFTAQDLFKYPTVADLANHVRKEDNFSQLPTVETGEIPLTPIQEWFFKQSLPHPHYWNQAVLLDVKAQITTGDLQKAVNQIMGKHPAFKLKFRQTEKGWIQELDNDSQHLNVDVVDLTDIPEIELSTHLQTLATQFQGQLNLETGRLFRVVYFQTAATTPDKILLIIHHLIVDGVSWRVILQDLVGNIQNVNVTPDQSLSSFQAKPSVSFPQWSSYLHNMSHIAWEADLEFWQKQAVLDFTLPVDFPEKIADNKENSAAQIAFALTETETNKMLLEISRTHKVGIQEILLTALATTLREWTGRSEIVIALETHGRGSSLDLDISDSVGWFTSLFPFRITTVNSNVLDNLSGLKEQLNGIPNNGLSYGILSQKPEHGEILPPIPQGIIFNYLGQFDEQIPADAPFTPAAQDSGISRHPENQRTFQLEITGLIVNRKLEIRFGFSTNLHREQTIRNLLHTYQQCLRNLLMGSEQKLVRWNPEDFPLANLNQEQFNIAVSGISDLQDIYPLAPVQEGIIFHANYEIEKDIYLQQVTGQITGDLNVEIFKSAWENCINHYSILRTSYIWESLPRPLARVHSTVNLPFVYQDWCGTDDWEQKWSDLLMEDRQQGLSTERAPLMRLILVKTDKAKWRFCWTHHHVLIDGWSLPLVFQHVISFYQAEQKHQFLTWPPVPNYRDFIVWLNQKPIQQAEVFWRDQLAGLDSVTKIGLTSDPLDNGADYQVLQTTLQPEVYAQLKNYANKHLVTVSTLINAAWAILISKYSGSNEVIFGVTVSGRPTELSGFEQMVGLFINTLPLRLKCEPDKLVGTWLKELSDRILSISEHSYSSLVDIQGWSNINRGESLFESIVVYENYPVGEKIRNHNDDLIISDVESLEKNHYPISLYALPGKDLTLKIAFQKIGTTKERQQLLQHVTDILNTLATKSPRFLGEICLPTFPLIPIKHQPPVATLADLFNQQVSENAKSPAILEGEKWLTYGELNDQANKIAQALVELGVTQETLVGVCVDRHAGLVTALLGIIKSGAAYLPIDPAFPINRLEWIINDSQAAIILTESSVVSRLPKSSARVLLLEPILQEEIAVSFQPRPLDLGSIAYIIYTSGSTGKPKGVQIEHQSLVNCLLSFKNQLQLDITDTLVAVTTISFDIAGLELFLPLISGAKLVIANQETAQDGFKLNDLLERSQATIMQATPTTWRLLLTAGWQPKNQFCALCGGEAIPRELATVLLQLNLNLWNVYGPTETTIWSTVKQLEKSKDVISIGREIANTSLYILDDGLNLLPEGIVGELYIGGLGLARGYRNNPTLTSTTFIPDPFAQDPGSRLYRTGDLARRLSNGEIEFLSRIDYQVKIRGYRIELGEIETILSSHPAITQAIVQAIGDTPADQRLVAYVVPTTQPPTIEDLRLYLQKYLPEYMIPSAWVFIDQVPLTDNNKIDRRALPMPNYKREHRDWLPPRNAIEEVLVLMWQELLKVEKVGVQDNFFHLGGHSLLVGQFHGYIKKVFGIDLALRELFDAVTIEKIALLLIEKETKLGNTEKIAKAFLRIKSMTPEEKANLLQNSKLKKPN
ncbi:amino acid adenylation domain-containing protein [Cylindrospermopsis raciborskii]|uniref:amino acid adenylation domain-containing protein n=1 Tax=Cylindrospermopsis raciborskii TaxID=77022 RepID=UPI003DA3C7F7